MNKFTLGAVAGASSLLVAVPILAQITGAAAGDQAATGTANRPVPSIECVTALANAEGDMLSMMDEVFASHKEILIAHQAALTAAAAITDDSARQEALKKAHEDMRTAMQAAREDMPDKTEIKGALKAACGDSFGPGIGKLMGMGPMGFGHKGRGHRDGPMFGKFGDRPLEDDNDNAVVVPSTN